MLGGLVMLGQVLFSWRKLSSGSEAQWHKLFCEWVQVVHLSSTDTRSIPCWDESIESLQVKGKKGK
jgi:hypothetical protein